MLSEFSVINPFMFWFCDEDGYIFRLQYYFLKNFTYYSQKQHFHPFDNFHLDHSFEYLCTISIIQSNFDGIDELLKQVIGGPGFMLPLPICTPVSDSEFETSEISILENFSTKLKFAILPVNC